MTGVDPVTGPLVTAVIHVGPDRGSVGIVGDASTDVISIFVVVGMSSHCGASLAGQSFPKGVAKAASITGPSVTAVFHVAFSVSISVLGCVFYSTSNMCVAIIVFVGVTMDCRLSVSCKDSINLSTIQ